MRYFTTDTHFGHPLVSVLRGFTTFDPGRAHYATILVSEGRKAAEDWAKNVVLDDSRLRFHAAETAIASAPRAASERAVSGNLKS